MEIDPLSGLMLLTDAGTRLDIPAEHATVVWSAAGQLLPSPWHPERLTNPLQ